MKTELAQNFHELLNHFEIELMKVDKDTERYGLEFLFAIRATLVAVRQLKKFF